SGPRACRAAGTSTGRAADPEARAWTGGAVGSRLGARVGEQATTREGAMTTNRRYAIPVEDSTWAVRNAFDTVFRWEYEEGRAALMNLYEKGKKLQWNTNARIDWSQNLDPENPQ